MPGQGAREWGLFRDTAPSDFQFFPPSLTVSNKSPLKSQHLLGGLDMDADYMLCFF